MKTSSGISDFTPGSWGQTISKAPVLEPKGGPLSCSLGRTPPWGVLILGHWHPDFPAPHGPSSQSAAFLLGSAITDSDIPGKAVAAPRGREAEAGHAATYTSAHDPQAQSHASGSQNRLSGHKDAYRHSHPLFQSPTRLVSHLRSDTQSLPDDDRPHPRPPYPWAPAQVF